MALRRARPRQLPREALEAALRNKRTPPQLLPSIRRRLARMRGR